MPRGKTLWLKGGLLLTLIVVGVGIAAYATAVIGQEGQEVRLEFDAVSDLTVAEPLLLHIKAINPISGESVDMEAINPDLESIRYLVQFDGGEFV